MFLSQNSPVFQNNTYLTTEPVIMYQEQPVLRERNVGK